MERKNAVAAILIEKCSICRRKLTATAERYVMGDLKVCCTPCAAERRKRAPKS